MNKVTRMFKKWRRSFRQSLKTNKYRKIEETEMADVTEMSEISKPEPDQQPDPEPDQQPLSDANASDLLQPGAVIRPEIQQDEVRRLSQRLYGITCLEIRELNSYDDRNFLIIVDHNMKNPIIMNDWPHGYVFKVMNSLDSQKLAFVDAQNEMMLFLGTKKITCPRPVANVYGKYFSLETLSDGCMHVVRLLEYQPGKIFHEVLATNNLFFQTGEFVAKLDKALKKFSHPAFETHKTLWMLENIPSLEQFVYVIKDAARRDMVMAIIAAFKEQVLDKADDLEKGLIHGDFNEQNILLGPGIKEGDYRVAGVLDFGDSQYSYLIFELAITMTYMMIETQDLDTGGLVVAGYTTIRIIPDAEYNILKVCVAARLCQSLVLGAYTHSLNPDNDYLLKTQKPGWELLDELWPEPDDKVLGRWRVVADKYLTQSYK